MGNMHRAESMAFGANMHNWTENIAKITKTHAMQNVVDANECFLSLVAARQNGSKYVLEVFGKHERIHVGGDDCNNADNGKFLSFYLKK